MQRPQNPENLLVMTAACGSISWLKFGAALPGRNGQDRANSIITQHLWRVVVNEGRVRKDSPLAGRQTETLGNLGSNSRHSTAVSEQLWS